MSIVAFAVALACVVVGTKVDLGDILEDIAEEDIPVEDTEEVVEENLTDSKAISCTYLIF